MAKALKAAITIAVVVFAIASIPFIAAALSMSPMALAVTTFVGTLAAGIVGELTSKGMNASAGNFGTKFAARSPLAPRQLVYGKCRVGGTIVHIETKGVDNYELHMVVALAGHEIEELTQLRINDISATTTTSTISGSTVHTVTNADFTNTENANDYGSGRLVRYSFEDGSQEQMLLLLATCKDQILL